MARQTRAERGGSGGRSAPDQGRPQPLFQRADALRHGRGRDAKLRRRGLKTAMAEDKGQGGKLGVIEHQFCLIGFSTIKL